jgi:hypothetical protein
MKLHCATIQAGETSFAVVLTPTDIVSDQRRAEQAIAYFETRCFQLPTVLVACDDERVPRAFFGRRDLAVLLAPIPPQALPWREITLPS